MSVGFEEKEPDFSLAEITADDALLDALGAGEPAPDGSGDLGDLLAAWRAELATDLPATDLAADLTTDLPAADLTTDLPATDLTTDLPATDLTTDLPAADLTTDDRSAPDGRSGNGDPASGASDADGGGDVVPITARRRRWAARIGAGVAAAVVALGGLAIAGAQSGPDSPLWPIARLVHPQHTETRTAERTIAAARDAARAGRYDDARRLLDRADAEVGRLRDPDTARRLREEIATIRGTLPTPTPPAAVPSAAPGGATGPTTPTTAPNGSATAGPGSDGGSTGGGGLVPGLPVNPPTGGNGGLPGIPVPVPTVPVPTLPVPPLPLPSLPVPIPTVTIPLPPLGR